MNQIPRRQTLTFKRQHAKTMQSYRREYPERAAEANLANRLGHLEARRAADAASYARRKEQLNALKRGQPCKDCGWVFPVYVMEYHHIKGEKREAVSRMVGRSSWEDVLAEIAKCVLLCSNCHRIRTYRDKENMGRKVGAPQKYKAA